ncbi:MAG TPA: TrmH family RNA methyltransferase [Candidatus Saccharimonadales bacterium]|nr:TrmH family RNA methyltransferase [Candidatus Saccharimonadales bacterium]
MNRLKPDVLRKSKPNEEDLKNLKHNPIYLVLDNVIDTYNIGSLFRLADAIGVTKLFICGSSEYPPSSRIHKAAVGTENWVPWEKKESTTETLAELKSNGVQIVAVEQDKRSISYKTLNSKIDFPVAIVIGNETDGVSGEVLDASDLIVELPMYGINHSFNVWGTAAIVSYKILELL